MDTMKRLSDKSPTVEKCFCCIDLRTAGIVLGIFCVLWSFWPTVLVCVIALPGHICWFFGIFKEMPKLLLIGSAFHACIYGLQVYASVYFAMNMGYDIGTTIFSGIIAFCLMLYCLTLEMSLYKSMAGSSTNSNNLNEPTHV